MWEQNQSLDALHKFALYDFSPTFVIDYEKLYIVAL